MVKSSVRSADSSALQVRPPSSRAGNRMFLAGNLCFSVVNEVSAFTMVMTMFAMIYKLMPHSHIEWRDVGVGAFAT